MSVSEIKKILHEKIEVLNDKEALESILNFLETDPKIAKDIDVTKHMEKLFSENDGLLKRLA